MKGSFQAHLCQQWCHPYCIFRKNWIYSKCDWNPCPPLIFQLMHQSFGLNKLAGLRNLLICHTPKHISLPQYELFNELFIILDWSCAQRTSSIINELSAPLWGVGKALRIIELWFESHCTEHKDKCSWPQWSMHTQVFFVCRQSLIGTNKPSKDVWFYFRRAEFYWFCFKNMVRFFFYLFSNKIWMQIKCNIEHSWWKNNLICTDKGHLCWIWGAEFL